MCAKFCCFGVFFFFSGLKQLKKYPSSCLNIAPPMPPPTHQHHPSSVGTDSQGLGLLSGTIWPQQRACHRVGVHGGGGAVVAEGVRREGGGLNLTATGLISAWRVVSRPPHPLFLSHTHTHSSCLHSLQPSSPHTHTQAGRQAAALSSTAGRRFSSPSRQRRHPSDHLDRMRGQLRTAAEERKRGRLGDAVGRGERSGRRR